MSLATPLITNLKTWGNDMSAPAYQPPYINGMPSSLTNPGFAYDLAGTAPQSHATLHQLMARFAELVGYSIIRDLTVEDNIVTKKLLPIVPTKSKTFTWTTITLDREISRLEADNALSRYVTYQTDTHSKTIQPFGFAIPYNMNELVTEEGQYFVGLRIADARQTVLATMAYHGMQAILTAKTPTKKTLAVRGVAHLNIATALQWKFYAFDGFHKWSNAFNIYTERGAEVLNQTKGAREATQWVVIRKVLELETKGTLDKQTPMVFGEQALKNSEPSTKVRKVVNGSMNATVWEDRRYVTGGSTMLNMLHRLHQHGGQFGLFDFWKDYDLSNYTSERRKITVFDAVANNFVLLSPGWAARHCGFYDKSGAKDAGLFRKMISKIEAQGTGHSSIGLDDFCHHIVRNRRNELKLALYFGELRHKHLSTKHFENIITTICNNLDGHRNPNAAKDRAWLENGETLRETLTKMPDEDDKVAAWKYAVLMQNTGNGEHFDRTGCADLPYFKEVGGRKVLGFMQGGEFRVVVKTAAGPIEDVLQNDAKVRPENTFSDIPPFGFGSPTGMLALANLSVYSKGSESRRGYPDDILDKAAQWKTAVKKLFMMFVRMMPGHPLMSSEMCPEHMRCNDADQNALVSFVYHAGSGQGIQMPVYFSAGGLGQNAEDVLRQDIGARLMGRLSPDLQAALLRIVRVNTPGNVARLVTLFNEMSQEDFRTATQSVQTFELVANRKLGDIQGMPRAGEAGTRFTGLVATPYSFRQGNSRYWAVPITPLSRVGTTDFSEALIKDLGSFYNVTRASHIPIRGELAAPRGRTTTQSINPAFDELGVDFEKRFTTLIATTPDPLRRLAGVMFMTCIDCIQTLDAFDAANIVHPYQYHCVRANKTYETAASLYTATNLGETKVAHPRAANGQNADNYMGSVHVKYDFAPIVMDEKSMVLFPDTCIVDYKGGHDVTVWGYANGKSEFAAFLQSNKVATKSTLVFQAPYSGLEWGDVPDYNDLSGKFDGEFLKEFRINMADSLIVPTPNWGAYDFIHGLSNLVPEYYSDTDVYTSRVYSANSLVAKEKQGIWDPATGHTNKYLHGLEVTGDTDYAGCMDIRRGAASVYVVPPVDYMPVTMSGK